MAILDSTIVTKLEKSELYFANLLHDNLSDLKLGVKSNNIERCNNIYFLIKALRNRVNLNLFDDTSDSLFRNLEREIPFTLDTLTIDPDYIIIDSPYPPQTGIILPDLSDYVRKHFDETINGIKTFVESPIVPIATEDNQAINLGQLIDFAPSGLRNQQQFIVEDNSNLSYLSDQVYIGQVITNDDELTAAESRGSSSQEDIFNKFNRASHGGSPTNPTGSEANNTIPGQPSQTNSWDYDTGSNEVTSTFNSGSAIYLISKDKFDSYIHTLTIGSDDTLDNDIIGVVIAFMEDPDDLVPNHAFGLDPNDFNWPINVTDQFIPNQHSLILLRSRNGGLDNAIVYDYLKLTQKVIHNGRGVGGLFETNDNWNGNTADLSITRVGDSITTMTSQFSDAPGGKGSLGFAYTFNLNSDPVLLKFKEKQTYGYMSQSQAGSFYSTIDFSGSNNVIYDLRNGDTYVFGSSGYVLDSDRSFFDEVGIRRELFNPYENKLLYVEEDGTILQLNISNSSSAILNQNSTDQLANFWISGAGKFGNPDDGQGYSIVNETNFYKQDGAGNFMILTHNQLSFNSNSTQMVLSYNADVAVLDAPTFTFGGSTKVGALVAPVDPTDLVRLTDLSNYQPTLTFTNGGITKSGSNVILGGSVANTTQLSLAATKTLSIVGSSTIGGILYAGGLITHDGLGGFSTGTPLTSPINSYTAGVAVSPFDSNKVTAQLGYYSNSPLYSLIEIDSTGMIITDTKNSKGLIGAADFSTNYTTLSYIQKTYVDTLVTGLVHLTGAETITGTKTFNNGLVSAAGTSGYALNATGNITTTGSIEATSGSISGRFDLNGGGYLTVPQAEGQYFALGGPGGNGFQFQNTDLVNGHQWLYRFDPATGDWNTTNSFLGLNYRTLTTRDLTGSGSIVTGFIQNTSSLQTSSNFFISGIGVFGDGIAPTRSTNYKVGVIKSVNPTDGLNDHVFVSNVNFTKTTSGLAIADYDGFDSVGDNTAAINYDHHVVYQARTKVDIGNTNTLTNLYGAFTTPSILTGIVTNAYGSYIKGPAVTAGASLVNNTGLFIQGLTAGSGKVRAILTGNNISTFGDVESSNTLATGSAFRFVAGSSYVSEGGLFLDNIANTVSQIHMKVRTISAVTNPGDDGTTEVFGLYGGATNYALFSTGLRSVSTGIPYFNGSGSNATYITTLSVATGGTGQSTYTNGQLLIGNTTGNTLTKATLTAGSGVTITNGTGSITLAADTTVVAAINGSPTFVTQAVGDNSTKAATTAYIDRLRIKASATLDFPSTAASNTSDLTITVVGAAIGDVVALGIPNGSQIAANSGAFYTPAWVSATDTVSIRLVNTNTLTAVNPASGIFTVIVFK